jgi:hypothetical protein
MDETKPTFSEEYVGDDKTRGADEPASTKSKLPSEEITTLKETKSREKELYGSGKPKRVIVRGKITQ